MKPLPLIAPNPPKLSQLSDALRRVEASGIYSNGGPEVRAFEAEATEQLFDAKGASLAVANATLGLMIAIRQAAGLQPKEGALALMPAMTFAATAQAAIWSGLTPLVCDIDPDDWSASAGEEDRLIADHGDRIAVVVPYATFGNAIDLGRYVELRDRTGVGVVIDAASSLGTIDDAGRGFGADARFAIVFSMHATKTFAVGEGGLVHSGDPELIAQLRAMTNFGFESGRSATLPGLNAKLPEVLAVAARAKLDEVEEVATVRAVVEAAYREALDGFVLQKPYGRRRAIQFMPVLLPENAADRRAAIIERLADEGIGAAHYFSPHLGQQAWFRDHAVIAPTPVADQIGARLLSLPVTDFMTADDARRVADVLRKACRSEVRSRPAATSVTPLASVLVVGGGPAGAALLAAASKRGLLTNLSAGLVMVECHDTIGGGRLGQYAISSDSTAQTFLSAMKDNPHPKIAALHDHHAARAVARQDGDFGVPLGEVGPLLQALGGRLATIAVDNGAAILTGHEAISARRTSEGHWQVRLKRRSDGHEFDQRTESLVIATGGHQPTHRLAEQRVAGALLTELAGDRLLQSDEVLTRGGIAKVAAMLADKPAPRIAVIGGSTSALTTIALLLRSRPGFALGAGAISLLHRRPLRPFYPSADAARAEGFADFDENDVCPVSGFVYRLAGFRLEARALVLRMLGIAGRVPDPRVAAHRIAGDDDNEARRLIADADLVIAALGYRPHALPLEDAQGRTIALAADLDRPMVDRHCRIVDASGRPIPATYGIGLAAGFVPWGPMGGEASFTGQANGLWLWQNDVGAMIVDQVLGEKARTVA